MAELEIKKSRFLCYLHKSFSEADAKDFIQKIKAASQCTTSLLCVYHW